MTFRRWQLRLMRILAALLISGCGQATPAPSTSAAAPASPSAATVRPTATPSSRREGRGEDPVVIGDPIRTADLVGRIVFDDFEDVYTMNADGSAVRALTKRAGAEFDGAWSPDGQFVVYRDSRRGINDDDEIFAVRADGTDARNLTNDPGNDWGPAWSPDGQWIAFNSDRDGTLAGFLVHPDGTGLRKLPIEGWVEYPQFSPDGTRIVYESASGSNYDVYIADLATGQRTRLTDSAAADGWPAWSPDGTTIAFTSTRDDCAVAAAGQDCWHTGNPGDHRDLWLIGVDGSNLRRVTPEHGQFLDWSPDGRFLLVSGHGLYVIRPDGTGRVQINPSDGIFGGGIPDWR